MANQVRVKLNYSGLSHTEVATEAVAVVDGLTNNPNFTAPPITPADLKAQVDIYVSLIAAANDGGKKTIIERDKQRAVVVKMLRQLGHWVEANCKEDAGILKSSGYQQASFNRTAPQVLDGPPSLKVENGPNSGQMLVRGKPVSKAVSYTVRFAALGADGKPGTWTEQPSAAIRSITVIGLTPGTTYAFQVRALGRLGNTDWSDSATRIAQ
jgi:Fibronectin type III domain